MRQAIRQHALSILADTFLDKYGSALPPDIVCEVLPKVCVPVAGKRIKILLLDESRMVSAMEEIMIEFEQCVSLLFKPLLHHLKRVVGAGADLMSVWEPVLAVLEELLRDGTPMDGDKKRELTPDNLRTTLKELASEHLRNAIIVFHANGVLESNPSRDGDDDNNTGISDMTWAAIDRMEFCRTLVKDWKGLTSQ